MFRLRVVYCLVIVALATGPGLLQACKLRLFHRGGRHQAPAPCPQPYYLCPPVGDPVPVPPPVDPDEEEFGSDLPQPKAVPEVPALPPLDSLRPKLD
jgi:hypothetical protein